MAQVLYPGAVVQQGWACVTVVKLGWPRTLVLNPAAALSSALMSPDRAGGAPIPRASTSVGDPSISSVSDTKPSNCVKAATTCSCGILVTVIPLTSRILSPTTTPLARAAGLSGAIPCATGTQFTRERTSLSPSSNWHGLCEVIEVQLTTTLGANARSSSQQTQIPIDPMPVRGTTTRFCRSRRVQSAGLTERSPSLLDGEGEGGGKG